MLLVPPPFSAITTQRRVGFWFILALSSTTFDLAPGTYHRRTIAFCCTALRTLFPGILNLLARCGTFRRLSPFVSAALRTGMFPGSSLARDLDPWRQSASATSSNHPSGSRHSGSQLAPQPPEQHAAPYGQQASPFSYPYQSSVGNYGVHHHPSTVSSMQRPGYSGQQERPFPMMAGMPNADLPLPAVGSDGFMETTPPAFAPGHPASAEGASRSPHSTMVPNPALPSPWNSIGFNPGTFTDLSTQLGHRFLTSLCFCFFG